jgi:hypothetical protein
MSLPSQLLRYKVMVAYNHDIVLDEIFPKAFSERRYVEPYVTASGLDFGGSNLSPR